MCCFSGPIKEVADTRIFARLSGRGTQYLVYQMQYASEKPVAMILPVPVRSDAGGEALRFCNLKDYGDLFDDLAKPFIIPGRGRAVAAWSGSAPSASFLPVYEVGDFVASFVPTLADFERVDPRFRLPSAATAKLPQYKKWGFAVFQLHGEAGKDTQPHPMAFEFATQEEAKLFFPTLHIHDGTVHSQEKFDHVLYTQWNSHAIVQKGKSLWAKSEKETRRSVTPERTAGIVNGDLPVYRRMMQGTLPNRDTWMTLSDLTGIK